MPTASPSAITSCGAISTNASRSIAESRRCAAVNPADRVEYAAELIGGENAADRLERLREQPGYRIFDTLRLQIADLIQSHSCAEKMPAERCRAAVESFLQERGAE